MPTSGTFTFTVNRDQIIRLAMMNIGKLDEVETPTAQEVTDCSMYLNMMVKQWQGKTDFAPGLKTFTRRRGYLFLNGTTGQYSVGQTATGWTNSFSQTTTTASAAAAANSVQVKSTSGIVAGYNIGIQCDTNILYWTTVLSVVGQVVTITGTLPTSSPVNAVVYCYQTTGTQPLQIEAAVLRDHSNSDTPMTIMQQPEYDWLPNKADPTNVGDPVSVYYENQLGNSFLYTDCGAANDVTKFLVLTYLEPIQDLTNPADNFEYSQEWFLPLSLGLAKLIAPMFNAPWTAVLESSLSTALRIAGNKDAERSVMYFQAGVD